MESVKEIQDYLGITDNQDVKYKMKVIAEYKKFKKIYSGKDVEMCLIEDIGTYIDVNDKDVFEYGKYIAVYRRVEK